MNWQLVALTLLTIISWGIGSGLVKIATKHMGERTMLWDAILYFLIVIPFFLVFFKGSYSQAFQPKAVA